jgi:DNA polymerase
LKCPRDKSFDDFIAEIANDFETLTFDQMENKWGDIPELLSSLLRAAIKAPDGYEFYTSDFSNIEGRVLFWISNDLAGLTVFNEGRCIYCEMASDIYGVPYNDLYASYKADDPTAKNQRQMGKQAILGLGYMMGANTFLMTLAGYSIAFNPFNADWESVRGMSVRQFRHSHKEGLQRALDYVWANNSTYVYGMTKIYRFDSDTMLICEFPNAESLVFNDKSDGGEYDIKNIDGRFLLEAIEKHFAQDIVDKYRSKFAEVKSFWYDCERAAIAALETGQPQSVNQYITYFVYREWLMCQLPSGRSICYYNATLVDGQTPWGAPCRKIRYMGLDSYTNKWSQLETYSGKLVENIVQAVSRDLLANSILTCEANDYPVVMHVHDEIVSLKPTGSGDMEQYNGLLCQLPDWANGLPIAAEGWHGVRYRKD